MEEMKTEKKKKKESFGQTGPEKKKRKSKENGFQRFYSVKLKKK